MSSTPPIIVTSLDHERLRSVLGMYGGANVDALEEELTRAAIVPSTEVKPNVVTMNSELVYEDVGTGKRRTVRLVYPRDADVTRSWVSVLAPLGSALLGLQVGQEIDWAMPGGARRLRLVEVRYQPEASGHMEL